MPAAKPKYRREATITAAKPQPQISFWEGKGRPFVEAHALLLSICLIVLATGRIVATYPQTGITFDEPGHMACGLQFVAQHVYRYESQHPPLARAMMAIGPYLDGARPTGIKNQDQEGVAVLYRNSRVLRTLILMRLGILPFFLLASGVVYIWGARQFGRVSAVAATALFTLLPPVLAHAGLATTDMALAASLGAAFLTMLIWAGNPGLKQSLLFGVATGVTVLSKFTGLAFLPAAAILALLAYFWAERPGLERLSVLINERARPFAIAVVTGAVVIWAGYLFSFGKVAGWGIPLPAPELFDGVGVAMRHTETGHMAYLLGQVSPQGWWYYFPVVLSVKSPIAFLVLLAVGIWIAFTRRRDIRHLLPLAFSLGILLPAMMGHVNIGVRHILPVYIGFALTAGAGMAEWLRRAPASKWAGIAAGALILWLAVSGAAAHPNYLAYFNAFAGDQPEHILVDSDLDWGQDTVRLARRLQEMGVHDIGFMTMNLDGNRLQQWPGIPATRSVNPLQPAEGWTAISPTFAKLTQFGLNYRYPNIQPWYEYIPPSDRVGSLMLYYIPPESLRR